jgi:nucleoside-diphosphate-sugar epimerase
MKIYVAGATGAVGRQLVPLLVERGHEVIASTFKPRRRPALAALGAKPVVVDGLDREAVFAAVVTAEPDVVVHQMTALAYVTDYKDFDAAFAVTNRLRTEGIDHLVKAARAAGARRVVAQSFGNWNYERTGSPIKAETDPLGPDPPASMRQTLDAIGHLERAVTRDLALDGIALRYGTLYGPGTNFGDDGAMVELIRRRKLPIVGSGEGIWSFVHVHDAALATVDAIEHGPPGIYNIADDDPAPAREWLPALATALGAKPPRRVPVWVGRLAAGEAAVSMMSQIRGAANAKAKRDLRWAPRYASWRIGMRAALISEPVAA